MTKRNKLTYRVVEQPYDEGDYMIEFTTDGPVLLTMRDVEFMAMDLANISTDSSCSLDDYLGEDNIYVSEVDSE